MSGAAGPNETGRSLADRRLPSRVAPEDEQAQHHQAAEEDRQSHPTILGGPPVRVGNVAAVERGWNLLAAPAP